MKLKITSPFGMAQCSEKWPFPRPLYEMHGEEVVFADFSCNQGQMSHHNFFHDESIFIIYIIHTYKFVIPYCFRMKLFSFLFYNYFHFLWNSVAPATIWPPLPGQELYSLINKGQILNTTSFVVNAKRI